MYMKRKNKLSSFLNSSLHRKQLDVSYKSAGLNSSRGNPLFATVLEMYDMESQDNEAAIVEIESRIAAAAKKRKIFFYLAWPCLALGVAMLLSDVTKSLGFGLILAGVVLRILYYRVRHEHITLTRYKRELGDKLSILAALLIAIFAGLPLKAQVASGDIAPDLSPVKQVAGDDSGPLSAKLKHSVIVLEFWATWDKTSKLTFNLFSEIQSDLPVDDVVFAQITKESERTVNSFLEKLPNKPQCAVCVDPKGVVSDKYLGKGAGIPQVFIIGKNGTILWKGDAGDLKYVLGKVISGEFDPGIQLKVIPMRKNLQRSMQLARYADVRRIAGDILAIDAADELAVRVMLFLYERDKRMNETPAFIDSLLRRSPKTPFLHLLKLDALNLTNASPEKLRSTAEKALLVFGDNHAALNRLASLLVNRLRFGTTPLDVALKASKKAVDLFFAGNQLNSDRLAKYLETRAKVYYFVGKFTDAVESQEKAANLMKGDPSEKRARILIDYYKSAKTLSK